MLAKRFTEKLRLPAVASLWYVGTSLTAKVIGFLITPVFTRTMSEVEYGSFTLYISTLGIASVLTSVFTHGSHFFVGLGEHRDKKGDYFASLLLVSIAFSVAICTVLFAFSSFFDFKRTLCLPLALQLILDSVVGIYLSSLRFSYRYKSIAAVIIAEAVAAPTIAILLIFSGVRGDVARITAQLLTSVVTALFSLYKLFASGGRVKRGLIKYSIKSSMPHLPASLSSAITNQADKLILTASLGTAALAKYSVAHSVGIGLGFAIGAMNSALTPWIVRHLDRGDEEKISAVILLIYRILSMMTLFLLAVSPLALDFLAPPEYSEAIYSILPISLSTLPAFLLSTSNIGLIHAEKGRFAVLVAPTSAILNILLNFMLIPYFGYLGAGLALLISQSVGALLCAYFLGKCQKNYLPSAREIFSVSLITLLFGVFIFLSLRDLPLRTLLLIVPSVSLISSAIYAKDMIFETEQKKAENV